MADPDTCAEITRRHLLRAGAGLGLAGGLLYLPGGNLLQAAQAADFDEVDYVVIGSGPGGGPLAANLAEAGFKVLVLEAGPPEGNRNYYRAPLLEARSEEDPEISWNFFVRHYSDIAAHGESYIADKGGVLYPRSSTIGGCCAHHFMLAIYPEHSDWEQIRQMTGDDGWNPERMWNFWQRILEWQPTETIVPYGLASDLPLANVVAASHLEIPFFPPGPRNLIGLSPNDRINVDQMAQGTYLTPQGTRRGVRVGPRERLLTAAHRYPARLSVATNALAERIVFERGPEGRQRAVAVRYLAGSHLYGASPRYERRSAAERRAIRREVRVRKEVIVAGGVYNSPQILMLSGIGPKRHLEHHGIKVLVDLPGVGGNLQDRVETTVVSQYESEWNIVKGCTFDDHDDPCFHRWDRSPLKSTELYSSNGLVAFIKRRYSKGPKRPELVLFGGPLYFKNFVPGFSERAAQRPLNYFTWTVLKAYARGRAGSVRLRSKDPTQVPKIIKRSLDDNKPGTYDAQAVIEGIETARRINSRVLFAHKEVLPGPAATDLDAYIRREQYGHHASCTNPMGAENDPNAVLDGKLRVRGTSNVRVVDASAFPRIPGTFIWIPVACLSEKASQDIIAAA